MDSNNAMNLGLIRDRIAVARRAAIKEAKSCGCCIFSRGTFIATSDAGGQCMPCPEAEAMTWDGTLKEILGVVARVKANYPNVLTVYIAGGYDGADSPMAMRDGDYDPWISSWEVIVWERDGA
jgi:hypothetical protein